GHGEREFLLNATPHQRDGVAALGAAETRAPDLTVQVTEADSIILDNGIIRAVVDANGLLTSLVDHASGRNAIAPGQ
ncbi:hypothetical protein SB847_22350, partial [Bacillus sp. SIMBA_026]